MSRPRALQAAEAPLWLAVLLDYSFSDKNAQKAARLDLLGIAHDATAYPNDIPNWRLAELLLRWAEQYVPGEDWKRLQARVRKRRSQ
ncbi:MULTISPECIES: hypothetical protein [Halomonadaceae]|jgi:hypothetical protein|uniref:Uncharacterized protein n=2 Tax=Vreelandella TaxID=3137766 RepID=A0A7Z0S0Q2_9GAMM|nr:MULTISPECIES: hypothetical protein [Halomonas]NYS80505.1 hypothetical protein [Halomonas glaciei]|tara:strand:+ start:6453 stop:6713 length:261 start_codon:yes stop_codon:yes gene_type:complete